MSELPGVAGCVCDSVRLGSGSVVSLVAARCHCLSISNGIGRSAVEIECQSLLLSS